MESINNHLDALLDLLRAADAAVMDIYNTDATVVTIKADNSPLTQADMASHKILASGLKKLFPQIPVVSEEGDEQANSLAVKESLFWLIDPLDGTKEFIARNGEFTICVALVNNGVPVFGMVSAPALGVIYYGGPELGCYKVTLGSAPQKVQRTIEKSDIVLEGHAPSNKATAAYISTYFPEAEMLAVGSQLKFLYVADGRADAYPRLDSTMKLWDVAAGQAILAGVGGKVLTPDGSAIDYHAANLLVGDFVARPS